MQLSPRNSKPRNFSHQDCNLFRKSLNTVLIRSDEKKYLAAWGIGRKSQQSQWWRPVRGRCPSRGRAWRPGQTSWPPPPHPPPLGTLRTWARFLNRTKMAPVKRWRRRPSGSRPSSIQKPVMEVRAVDWSADLAISPRTLLKWHSLIRQRRVEYSSYSAHKNLYMYVNIHVYVYDICPCKHIESHDH